MPADRVARVVTLAGLDQPPMFVCLDGIAVAEFVAPGGFRPADDTMIPAS